MKAKSLIRNVYEFYRDGFRNMTVGRTLWVIVLLKLFIMFFILRLFLFPNFLNKNAGKGNEADFVSAQITNVADKGF